MKHPATKLVSTALLCLAVCAGSGCVVSRFCAKTLNVGVVEYYADFSDIRDDTIYKSADKYYIYVRERGYHPSLSQFALIAVPLSYDCDRLEPVGDTAEYSLVEIDGEYAAYIGSAKPDDTAGADKDRLIIRDCQRGRVVAIGAVDISGAEQLPVRVRSAPPEVMTIDIGHECLFNTLFIRREKDPKSWRLIPLAPLALAADIPASLGGTVVFYTKIITPKTLFGEAPPEKNTNEKDHYPCRRLD